VHLGGSLTGVVHWVPPQPLRQHFRIPSQVESDSQEKMSVQPLTEGSVACGIGQYPTLLGSTGGVDEAGLQVSPQESGQHL
jgi:hypothetical protein